MALSLQWFSQHDLMDGLRARRQKSGSPLGRVIDEALDMIQQTCYMMWFGYLMRFDNFFLEQILLMVNVVFHTMEMKYIMCKNLNLVVGEIGPVEMELILSTLYFVVGGCLGAGSLDSNLGELFGIENETIANIQMKYITGSLFLPILCVFLYENLGDCIKESPKDALYHFAPVIIIMFEGYLMSFTVSYQFERAIIFVMLNMCIANVTLHLMLTNMSKKAYSLLHPAYVYPLLPVLA